MKNTKKQTKNVANRLFSKNARPKMITVNFVRKGNKYLVENGAYLHEVNQYVAGWERLDARNLHQELVQAARTGTMVVR